VAWTGIWAATVVFVALIVFMLQNTANVEINFLGMHGTLPGHGDADRHGRWDPAHAGGRDCPDHPAAPPPDPWAP
jgi:hypothetical protein